MKSHNRVQEDETEPHNGQRTLEDGHNNPSEGNIMQGSRNGLSMDLEGELTPNGHPVFHGENGAAGGRQSTGLFTDLLHGDYVSTSRGLIPRSVFLPPLLSATTPHGKKVTFRRDILPTDEGSRIGVVYFPKGNLAEMHYIINGEDQGACTRKLPYKDGPLYAVVDVYGTTKQVRIVQLYGGVASLKKTCRTTILRHIAMHGIKSLPLPRTLKDYLLYET